VYLDLVLHVWHLQSVSLDPMICPACTSESLMLYVTLRHNLVPRRRKRRAIGHPGTPPSHMAAPNEVWSADFKGHFKTGDGRYCYPLTITDNNSRFLLGCEALSSTRVQEAKHVFTHVFKEFGLPQRIRTDNGVPFATNTLARLSQLSVKSSIMSVRTRHSTCTPPPPAMNPPHGKCPTSCHHSSTPAASRCATSVLTGVSVGTINRSTSHTSALANMSALRQSTMASGMSTSDPSHAAGASHDTYASQMSTVD
jgi:hypothetical protein